MQRRQFLANLLFAGGALSVVALQGELLAQTEAKDPKKAGWELPEDWKDSEQPQPQNTPEPKPTQTPPPLLGDVAPPTAGVPVLNPPKPNP